MNYSVLAAISCISALFTCLSVPSVKYIALKQGWIDKPNRRKHKNQRKTPSPKHMKKKRCMHGKRGKQKVLEFMKHSR